MKITKIAGLLFVSLTLAAISAHADTLTYKDLVHRLYNLDALAQPPKPGELGALASSYDRGSQYDAANDKYINWGANGDGGGIIRTEGNEAVLAEIQGPGCIVRTWSASAGHGHVKIYLDGSETPTVDLPFAGYFNLAPNDINPPFNRPNLDYLTKANGFNNYTPIPFQKSCKIVGDIGPDDKGWGNYYHFNYVKFPEGTTVPTFKLPLSAEDSAALDEADKILGNSGVDPAGTRASQETKSSAVTVDAGGKSTVAELSGSGAITAIKVKFDLPTDPAKLKDFLRQLAIRITWDGQAEPAVWAPIGDFFGDAVLPAKYQSLPMGITADGQWYSYWYMPYGSGAKIEVENDSADPVAMNWEITHAPLDQSAAKSLLRFHAKWHRDAFLTDRKDRWPDWTLLTTQGTGRYVGTQLHVWNPLGGWWGEGDEKWFVDGEKFPSTIGTGSEDYFGYAWSSGNTFNQALHGQPVNENNQGNVSVHRWHVTDDIPFQKQFEGDIEKYMPNTRHTMYAAVAYWYLSPDGTDPYKEVPVADRIGYYAPLGGIGPDGKVEGEFLKVTKGGSVDAQDMSMFATPTSQWSDNNQLWWHTQKNNDHVELALPPMKAGKYKLSIAYTHADDYGIVQASINGTPAGSPTDCYNNGVIVAPPIDLGTVEIKDGPNTLGLDSVGKNEKNTKESYLVGIDYLKFVPAQ